MDDYRLIADQLAAEIATGHRRPGDQFLPQRQFARQQGIANSTAARVYGELIRRGLAVGEVGRGTFVRTAEPPLDPALAEPGSARVDLELNFPILSNQPALLAESLQHLLRPDTLAGTLRPPTVAGSPENREAAASLLTRATWTPNPDSLLFAGNGRQAIAAAIATLVPTGERLGVERLTYPVVKGIASRLGVTLVPLPMDEHGLIPDALPPMRAIYLQPALHNPLGTTMPVHRRTELAETLRHQDIYAIEDAVYGFLRPDIPPLAALAPERVILVDSLSKRIAPGLTVGYLTTPETLTTQVATTLRSGTWAASHFALAAATQWSTDGTAETIQEEKRKDAQARQQIATTHLPTSTTQADPNAYHLWWTLPDPWRAETFVAAAARQGIAVTPAAAFTIGTAHAPNAIRLALSSPTINTLTTALDTLTELAKGTPHNTDLE